MVTSKAMEKAENTVLDRPSEKLLSWLSVSAGAMFYDLTNKHHLSIFSVHSVPPISLPSRIFRKEKFNLLYQVDKALERLRISENKILGHYNVSV